MSLVTVWQILKTGKVERVDGIEMEGATGLARDISESQVDARRNKAISGGVTRTTEGG